MPATSASSPRAFLADFGAHYAGLLRFLTRRTGCAEAARDLAHDTWVRLAEHGAAAEREGVPGGAEPLHNERAYLYTVAANLASNWQRHVRRGEQWFVPEVHAELARVPAAPGDVAHDYSVREAATAVEHALQALPERRRAIFLAHRLDAVPHETLAQQHRISVKTVEREVMQSMDAVHAALLRWRGDVPAVSGAARGRRRALSALLSLAGASTAGVWARQWWRHGVAQFELSLATPRARLLRQALPDGSEITLDADTRAQVAFYGDRRQVVLDRGSAFFAVARDAARPFIVETRLARITVLGTRFEVETGADDVHVAVESGRVRVQALAPADSADGITLRAGERARVGAGGGVHRLAGADMASREAVAAWREGWLDFQGLPLATAVKRLARYTDVPVRVAGDAAALSVLGRVRIGDAAHWLRLLPQMLPVSVRRTDDGSWEIGRK